MRQSTVLARPSAPRRLLRAALRVAAGFAFSITLMLVLRLFGVPVPGPLEMLEKLKDVTKLAETLS